MVQQMTAVRRGMDDGGSGIPHDRTMTIAGNFIRSLQHEQKQGNVSSETEQHLKHEFRKIGRDAPGATLAEAVDAEIERLERQAATLRRMRDGLLSLA